MKWGVLTFTLFWLPFAAVANITSKGYVDAQIANVIGAVEQQVEEKTVTKVDTSAGTVQTLNGDYTVAGSIVVTGSFTVTGAFKVPTPPLPNPDAE